MERTIQKADRITTYHQPDQDGIARIGAVRRAAADMIVVVAANCPPGADRSAAIRKVREAMMTANAAIVVPAVDF